MVEHATMPAHAVPSDMAGIVAIHKASVDLPHDPVPGVAEDVRRRRAVFKAYRIGLLTFHLVLLAVIFSMGIGWVTVMNYGNPGVFEFMVPTAAGFLIAWAALSYIFAIGTGALMYMCKVRVQIYTLVSVGLGLFSGYVLAHYFIRLGMNVILMVFYG